MRTLNFIQELGIKNHYHKKKLQLALQAIGSDTRGPMDELDHNWVTRKCQNNSCMIFTVVNCKVYINST